MTPPRSTLALRDLLAEARSALGARPARSLLTALGTTAGVATLVATTGLASTAQAQVSSRFDALVATEVRVTDARPDGTDPFPDGIEARLGRLRGVVHAGVYWVIDRPTLDIGTLPTPTDSAMEISVVAASPGALAAARPTLRRGRLYDTFHQDRGERVAVLGDVAARRLGLTRIDTQPTVFLGGRAFAVLGIVSAVQRMDELRGAVMIPSRTAEAELPSPPTDRTVIVEVAPGAAELIGRQAPIALRPDDSGRLQSVTPPDQRALREAIGEDLAGLLYALGGLALLVGAVGIANTTLVAVMERRAEIGVRRALGARQRHVAAQFLVESGALGALGGAIGSCVGVLVVVALAATRGWTTIIDPRLAVAAPFLGVATGLLAGVYPAIRAARTEPTDALRAG